MKEKHLGKAVSNKGFWPWLGWTGSILALDLAFFKFVYPRLSPYAQGYAFPVAKVVLGVALAGVFVSVGMIVILAYEKRRLRKQL